MKMNQIFYAALTARIVSLLCLAVFFYSLYSDLEVKTTMQALGISFTAWLVGSFFVGVYKDSLARIITATMVAADNVEEEVQRDDDEDNYSSHPIFEDDDNE